MTEIPGYQQFKLLYKSASTLVYRAYRNADNCSVIIKTIPQKALTEKKIQRLQKEFAIGQQLLHSPYVVHYFEFMQDPTYGAAIIMEDDKAVELASQLPAQGFSESEFLAIAIEIVQGLQTIHAANIVHNDINPSNILLQPENKRIKITDFNRASTVQQEMQPTTLKPIGTLAYIAPEQTGRVNRSVDYRADFYGLGVTFYQLLCGQLPFTAEDALGFIHQHLAKQPQPLEFHKPAIARSLAQIVVKLLEKEAENRYQSCEGILYDLTYCLSALKETGTIPEFKLGQGDFSNKFIISQYLYGREYEVEILMRAFECVSHGNCEALMVAGQPGVGKTMLIQELQQSIALKNGYFISGKFDQLKKNVAYSALTQAFDTLIKLWLADEDEARISHRKQQLLDALGTHIQLISKVVPALTLLVGERPTTEIADINQAKKVFYFAFQKFITLCANADHPLVIFFDDLQWADPASLELMAYVLQQPATNHLLWLAAYRDSEVTAAHPVMQTVAALREAGVSIQTLLLAPLPLTSLQTWIADSLHMPLNVVSTLAELIYQKTAGNPFFVKHFLQSLYEQRLLVFASNWQWDIDKIRQHPAMENVITLMTYQIQQLALVTQEALSIASCLGHRLTINILQTAMACSQEAVYEALQPALNSGILIQQSDNELYFAHDRVQEAAYQLIGEKDKAYTHFTIGQRLLTSSAGEREWLLDIVDQFNRCRALVTASQERLHIAHLNLQAGQKVKQATAYKTALNYLYASCDWVDIQALWQNDYPFAFTLYKELAEVEYLSGNFEASEALIMDMQPRLKSNLDQVESFHLLIIQKTVQGQHHEAIRFGRHTLQLLGSELPLENLDEFIQTTAFNLKQKFHNKPILTLLDAPLIVDPEKQAIFKILASIYGACYQTGTELLSATTLMAVNLSLTAGHALESCHSYAAYGLLLCGKFQEYNLGYQFGSLALQLAKKLKSPSQHCKSSIAMLGCIYPWSKSIQQLPALLTNTYEECLTCGEPEYAGYCAIHKVQMLFYQGASLAKIQQEAEPLLQFSQSTKNQITINIIQAIQRLLNNLISDIPDDYDFDINTIAETKFEKHCQQTKSFNALCLFYINRTLVFYLYGNFKQALADLILAKKNLAFILANYATANFNWYDSLVRLALYSTVSNQEQQTYLQEVIQNQRQMRSWQGNCPENFAHKYHLVEAELARIRGNDSQAEEHYNLSVELAGKHGFIHEQALAAEMAAQYWLARGMSLCAQGYLNAAFNGYKQWGAKRKLALFKAKYANVLQALAPPTFSQLIINQETTLGGDTLKLLDLASILKASHAISTEIELPKFLCGMMQIIIENAGAQQGALLFVEADETITVQAEYAKDGTIITLQNIPLPDWGNGAHAVIQYVKRTRQSVVIGNAVTDEYFKTDPYIGRMQAKSIFCIPLLKHAELKAILYLENNLISNAFNAERVQTVLILTAQMTISLENARYFVEQIALARQLAEQSARAEVAEKSLHSVSHNLELALQASKAGTWNLLINSQKVTWDDTCCALFGLNPNEFRETTYEAVIERIHPDDRKQVQEAVKRCIEQDIPYEIEYRVIWPDGSQHIISAYGRNYRDQKTGQPLKMAGVCLDVTMRKQLEQERFEAVKRAEIEERQRAEEAEKHSKNLELFVDTVCHEIRNPLNGIYGYMDFLSQTITSLKSLKDRLSSITQVDADQFLHELKEIIQKQEEILYTITECVKHGKTIINDVLNLSRLNAGKVELTRKPFQPKMLIEDTLRLFNIQLSAKRLELLLDLPKETIPVLGDPTQFRMILMNLISNAIKFTEKGHIKVSLQMQTITASQVALTINVEDTGIGMTPEEKAQLFQRFYRPTSSQFEEGSGLGLTITKKTIELMGGTIAIESEKGRGSKFTVNLTCELAAPETQLIPSLINEKPLQPQAPKYILVVEDNLMNQRILKKQLEQAGHQCIVASNGLEAIEKYEQETFDVIFMDREMPGMDGLEATKRIRSREEELHLAKTPIIGLSAYARNDLIQEGLAAGMNAYLTKPYEKEKLYAAIEQWAPVPHEGAVSREEKILAETKTTREPETYVSFPTKAIPRPEVNQQTVAQGDVPSFWSVPRRESLKPQEAEGDEISKKRKPAIALQAKEEEALETSLPPPVKKAK